MRQSKPLGHKRDDIYRAHVYPSGAELAAGTTTIGEITEQASESTKDVMRDMGVSEHGPILPRPGSENDPVVPKVDCSPPAAYRSAALRE